MPSNKKPIKNILTSRQPPISGNGVYFNQKQKYEKFLRKTSTDDKNQFKNMQRDLRIIDQF